MTEKDRALTAAPHAADATDETQEPTQGSAPDGPARPLSDAAKRALAEAEARRAAASGEPAPKGKELGGRDGPEPTRYGDWEKGGIVSDF